MKQLALKNFDTEDLEEILLKMERSFEIHFEPNELAHVNTFEELLDEIKHKIVTQHRDGCTTQQAFYKLRLAINQIPELKTNQLVPSTKLAKLFPRKSRKYNIKKVEAELGFELMLLRPLHLVSNLLSILLLVSIVGLFFNWMCGISGTILSIIGIWIANKTGKELQVATLGELAEKMTRESYMKSRREAETVNMNEIDQILREWLEDELEIDLS